MNIYPAIDLIGGACVRLVQGDYGKKTVYNENPVEVAKQWEAAGAKFLHLVDLDGAKAGKGINDSVIEAIAKETDLSIQVGGGIRTAEDVQKKFDLGVDRVILGTIAQQKPAFVKEMVERYGPEAIVVGVDGKSGQVAIEGWEKVSEITTVELCKVMKDAGVETVIYTDISKDGMMEGPSFDTTKEMMEETGLQIIASGGVSSYEDVDRLRDMACYGAIIGKALYTGAIDLGRVIKGRG